MSLNQLVIDFLAERGIAYREVEFGVTFKYNDLDYLFVNDDNDEQYFRLVIPYIHDFPRESRERLVVYNAMNTVNSAFKVVKAYVDEGTVNVAFEILADSTPVVEDIMPRALGLLHRARKAFYHSLDEQL